MSPLSSLLLMADPGGVVIVGKSGALRIARDGLTMGPIDEAQLIVATLLITRAYNDPQR